LNQLDLFQVLQQTSPFTRAILVILIIVSIWSWGIILSKTLLLRRIHRESETFWKIFRRGKSLSEVSTACEALRFTPLVPVFNAAIERPSASVGALQRIVQRASAAQMTRLERRMNFLATTASVAPFVGLFGTVWGVMTSFAALGNASAASLHTVAPGIADALIATAFGLFTAIPAVVAYNNFVYQLRNVGGQLDELQLEMLASAERNSG
jgi:biopolymer transport protein TolQ